MTHEADRFWDKAIRPLQQPGGRVPASLAQAEADAQAAGELPLSQDEIRAIAGYATRGGGPDAAQIDRPDSERVPGASEETCQPTLRLAPEASYGSAERARRRAPLDPGRRRWRRLIMTRFCVPAGVAAVLVIGVCLFLGTYPARPASAAEVLAQAVQAESKVRTLHIVANVRTIPHDNFHYIGLDCQMVRHEIWKDFGPPARWRLEKPGRVIVVDDQQLVALIRPNVAWKATGSRGDIGWFGLLLEPDKTLDAERQAAQAHGWSATVTQRTTSDGRAEIVLAVEAKALATYTNNYLKDSSIADADTRRIYRFDADSKLLKGVQIFVHGQAQDTLVAEVTGIEYDQPIDSAVFSLPLPDDVRWVTQTQVLPDNAKYEAMKPDEAARAFFQACADRNWEEVAKFDDTPLDERSKEYLGGMEIIKIGEPFQSGQYGGWFVPYEIKLKNGDVRKWNLAIRNDNPAHRYVVDGGI